MDWNWFRGVGSNSKVKAKWGKLTADDLMAINGRREELEGKIQQRYGLAKDQVRKEIDDKGLDFSFLGARRRAEPIKPPSVSTGAVL